MKVFIIGLLLLILASFFIPIISIINYILVIKNKGFKTSKTYFLSTAKNLDIWGCSEFRFLFNQFLLKNGGYKFGRQGETISSVIGKNKKTNTLTTLGYIIYQLLNKIDKNHCENAIQKF